MTVPAAVRQAKGIKDGDHVEFKVMNIIPGAEAGKKGTKPINAELDGVDMENAGGAA